MQLNTTSMQSSPMLLLGMRLLLLLFLAVCAVQSTAAAADSLFDAVAAGDTKVVEGALAGGANVDSRAADQATLLIAAALSNQPSMVELLLSKGADVSARNSGGFTPLDEQTADYNAAYGPQGTASTGPALVYDQIIDVEAATALQHITSGSVYTHTLHQGNLRLCKCGDRFRTCRPGQS